MTACPRCHAETRTVRVADDGGSGDVAWAVPGAPGSVTRWDGRWDPEAEHRHNRPVKAGSASPNRRTGSATSRRVSAPFPPRPGGIGNLIFVVTCNFQRLDGPVRGNGKIVQGLEAFFRGAGRNVVKVIWGGDWDPLLEKDADGLIVQRMNETVDGECDGECDGPIDRVVAGATTGGIAQAGIGREIPSRAASRTPCRADAATSSPASRAAA